MNSALVPHNSQEPYRDILGVRFFVGDAPEAVEIGAQGGLVVVPAAPALVELGRDSEYGKALLGADLVITDSGFMVLLWNLMMWDDIHRVSGLEYLDLLLRRPEFKQSGAAIWVMPSHASLERNVAWLRARGFPVEVDDCYVAPHYAPGPIIDEALAKLVELRQVGHVIIGLGGGVQEKLGFYLKKRCSHRPGIHCIGAAIGFMTGDQVRIPMWADRWVLGWLFRCLSNPKRFFPRYVRALRLAWVLWKYRSELPEPEPA